MSHDLRQQFWWIRMKREAAHYVFKCDTCQKVRADYMKHGGLLQPLSISDWKCDDITMEFIVGLPLTDRKFDSIWVIVDRLSKSAHFKFKLISFFSNQFILMLVLELQSLHTSVPN
jgi:hypothetical protein